MTKKAQIIAIARAAGYRKCPCGNKNCPWWVPPGEPDNALLPLPDFLSDLNAMHLVEEGLTADQSWTFTRKLQDQQGTAGGKGAGYTREWEWHATAAQRAKAFLQTLNLWVP
jgi:hypothetical protein